MIQEKVAHTAPTAPEQEKPLILPVAADVDLLQQLYRDNDLVRAHEKLTEIAYDYLSDNFTEEHTANMTVIRSRIASDTDKGAAIENNKRLLERAKQAVLDHAKIEGTMDAYKIARDHIVEIVERDRELNGDLSKPLLALGILCEDQKGSERWVYPRGLFPEETNAKWQSYIQAVKQHVFKAENLQYGGAQSEVVDADRSRRVAHDAISRDVQTLLGFEDTEEGFEEARSLVAKMRENRFPTVDTGESARIASRVEKGIGHGSVVDVLRDRFGRYSDPESFRGQISHRRQD